MTTNAEMSPEIGMLAEALAKAQATIQGATKDAANPFFKSKYADLASVWDACRQSLSSNGLSVVQLPSTDGPSVTVMTRLLHSSGQWISGSVSAVAKDAGPQSVGSAITYLRRYALQSFVGVAPEDDDGNGAQDTAPPRHQAKRPAPAVPDVLEDDDAWRTELDAAFKAAGFDVPEADASISATLAKRKLASITDLSPAEKKGLLNAVATGKADKFKASKQPAAA